MFELLNINYKKLKFFYENMVKIAQRMRKEKFISLQRLTNFVLTTYF